MHPLIGVSTITAEVLGQIEGLNEEIVLSLILLHEIHKNDSKSCWVALFNDFEAHQHSVLFWSEDEVRKLAAPDPLELLEMRSEEV